MQADTFLDTNIILYAYDLDAGHKRELALAVVERGWREPGSTAISVQVLQEFYVNFLSLGQSHDEALAVIEDLSRWPVADNSLERFGEGLALCKRHQLSLWDSMILAAAKSSGAHHLLSEDLNHGQDYDGVTVINPFIDPKERSPEMPPPRPG